jgi:hypothetical protein
MTSLRRAAALLLIAAFAALTAASCAKNDLFGRGLELWIGVKGVGPQGLGPNGTGCDVTSIDSVVFVQDVDSTALQVSSFVLTDSLGRVVPGRVVFSASNVYIALFQPWPGMGTYSVSGGGGATSAIGKVYFVPQRALSGHAVYTYSLTTGVRMKAGRLVRDVQSWSFATGDSVPPPAPASRPN